MKLKSSVSSLSVSVSALSHIIGGVTPRGRGDRRPGSAPQLQLVLEHNRVGLQSEPPVSHRAPERVIRPLGRLLPPEPDLLPYSQEETHSSLQPLHKMWAHADKITQKQCGLKSIICGVLE